MKMRNVCILSLKMFGLHSRYTATLYFSCLLFTSTTTYKALINCTVLAKYFKILNDFEVKIIFLIFKNFKEVQISWRHSILNLDWRHMLVTCIFFINIITIVIIILNDTYKYSYNLFVNPRIHLQNDNVVIIITTNKKNLFFYNYCSRIIILKTAVSGSTEIKYSIIH